MAKEGVVKRKFIPQNIIEELNAKYPQECEENGISYKIDLKYITFDPNEDITARMRAYDSEIGFGMMNVIFYFATEMIKDGYRTKYDKYEYTDHINTCSSKYHIPFDKVHQIVQFLISCNYFFVITDNENSYLTTTQAVYDYERCMHTRTENRKRKQKSREKYKQIMQTQNMLPATPPPLPLPEYPPHIDCNQQYDYPNSCNQEYNYPGTCNEELDNLDDFERQYLEEDRWREEHGLNPPMPCYDEYGEDNEMYDPQSPESDIVFDEALLRQMAEQNN